MVVASGGGGLMGGLKPVIPGLDNPVLDYGYDRAKDYVEGVGSYALTTNLDEWNRRDANNSGLTTVGKGATEDLGKSFNR
ncbi:hypothetical protein, partial [Rothia nasisuis]|uniref:hypothetical protein n=1 Tax=Rothia nasisuis TaxID=2109647 RepID=UPI001F15CC04